MRKMPEKVFITPSLGQYGAIRRQSSIPNFTVFPHNWQTQLYRLGFSRNAQRFMPFSARCQETRFDPSSVRDAPRFVVWIRYILFCFLISVRTGFTLPC